jgi:Ca2+-binding EF-hand superfamily protein
MMLSTTAAAQDASDSSSGASDRATLVIMSPSGPTFADVRISIGNASYRQWVATFLARKLDADGDGQLSAVELDGIPPRLKEKTRIQSSEALLNAVAEEPGQQQVTCDQFAEWFANQLSRDFEVIAEAIQASDAVRLASLIDQNEDGRIAQDELAAAGRQLRFRDLDDDQTFSAAELMPFRDPRNQQAAVIPDVANLPFIQLTDPSSADRIVDRLLKRYGDGTSMDVATLRMSAAQHREGNWSADVDAAQLKEFLLAPEFHMSINILLSDRSSASRIDATIAPHAAEFCLLDQSRRDRLKMVVDDMPLEIRSRGGGAQNRTYLIGFLGQHFTVADADKNQYLDQNEFAALAGQLAQAQVPADFNAADLDGDEQITRSELRNYVERDTIAVQSHIEVSVRQDGKTLFKLLDQNLDRRISQREFQDGFPQLLEYDLNGDGLLAETELGTSYVLQIGLGQPEALRGGPSAASMMMQSVDAVLPGTTGLAGPEWFRRMDRNQDGDLSLREFPGSQEMFHTVDLDGDGLISADEADMVTE